MSLKTYLPSEFFLTRKVNETWSEQAAVPVLLHLSHSSVLLMELLNQDLGADLLVSFCGILEISWNISDECLSLILEWCILTLYLMAILQLCFLRRNGEKSLLMSHLHKIAGWMLCHMLEYLKNEVGWMEGSESFSSEVRDESFSLSG